MLKKELHTVLKPSLFFILVAAGVSLVIKIVFSKEVSYFEVFFLMFQYSLLGFSMVMGLSMFLPDKKQGAGDYVLSLPYTRMRLLLMKLLPRLAAVAVFYILFLMLYQNGGKVLIMRHIFMLTVFFYWLLFLVSLSFSASADGYMKLGGVALLGVFLYLVLICFLPIVVIYLKGGSPQTVLSDFLLFLDRELYFHRTLWQVVLLLFILPYLTSFVLAFKKWGPFSKENYNRGFFKLFIPLTVGVFFLAVLLMAMGSGKERVYYYLTSNAQLLEMDGNSNRLIDTNGEVKLKYPGDGFIPFYESNHCVYGARRERGLLSIVRLDLEKYTAETLLKFPRGYWYYIFGIRVFEHIIVVPQHKGDPGEIEYAFIDTQSKDIKRIKTTGVLPPDYHKPAIFGADRDPNNGKIFWLIFSERPTKYPVIKLWESGEMENLEVLSGIWPVYVNRLLITSTGEDLVISRITGTGVEVVRRLPGLRKFSFHLYDSYDRVNLNTNSFKVVYLTRMTNTGEKDYIKLDLETFEFNPLDSSEIQAVPLPPKDSATFIPISYWQETLTTKITPTGEVYHFKGEVERGLDRFRFYLNKIYRLEGEKFILLKEFPPYKNKREDDGFWSSPNGVVIRQDSKLSVYAFPDLKPLEFKKK